VEAACRTAGRARDYPGRFAAGLAPHAVEERYYYARRPEINRVADVGGVVDRLTDANRANRAKGPAGHHGSRPRAGPARRGQKLPLPSDGEATADRNCIREFILARRRAQGLGHGVLYAEAFHHGFVTHSVSVGKSPRKRRPRGALAPLFAFCHRLSWKSWRMRYKAAAGGELGQVGKCGHRWLLCGFFSPASKTTSFRKLVALQHKGGGRGS
jgi:hypothetical protein